VFRQIALVTGGLYLHSMPGRFESWQEFQNNCAKYNIDRILCLTSMLEIAAKSPEYASAIELQKLSCGIDIYPIQDFSSPEDQQHFSSTLQLCAERLQRGESLLIPCAAGIGRTGSSAICLLLKLGYPLAEASDMVTAAGSGPETSGQKSFIASYAQRPNAE